MNGTGLIVDGGLTHCGIRMTERAANIAGCDRRIGWRPDECSVVQQAELLARAVTLEDCSPDHIIGFARKASRPIASWSSANSAPTDSGIIVGLL